MLRGNSIGGNDALLASCSGPQPMPEFCRHDAIVTHIDDNRDGHVDRTAVDFDHDDVDDLTITHATGEAELDFHGQAPSRLNPTHEGYDAGAGCEAPVNVTTYVDLLPCGTKARLAIWPRAASRAIAMIGLFKVWTKARQVRALIRQAHVIFVLNRAEGT